MGKISRQQTGTIKTKHQQSIKKRKSGRPINGGIETLFIHTIRDTKLQAINAEAELELELAFFTNEQDKKSRKRYESSVSDKWTKIYEFSGLNPDLKNKLHQAFDECQKKWTFEQIQQESDLQQFLFDDQTDLAFILHHIINKRRETIGNANYLEENQEKKENQSSKIRAQQLFYLCLLSLNSRQNLRDVVLDFLLKNQFLIVNILWAGMQKAKLKYSEKINKEKQDYRLVDHNQNILTVKQLQIPGDESICDQSEFSKAHIQKKKIKKPLRKQSRQFQFDSDESQEAMTQKEKEQKLILCFVNYITWSYFYVFGEEQKLLQELQKQQPARNISLRKPF